MAEQAFPTRVTLGEDGVYRWSYEMDMYRNHYLRNVLLKVTGVICLVCYLFLMFLFLNGHSLTPGIALGALACFLGFMLLVLAGYYLAAVIMHGRYLLRFEMNEEAIMLVRNPSTQAMMDTIARAFGSGAMRNAANSGLTFFKDVRGMKERRHYDAFNLRTLFGANQIWICPEDYEFVRDFVRDHIPQSAIH